LWKEAQVSYKSFPKKLLTILEPLSDQQTQWVLSYLSSGYNIRKAFKDAGYLGNNPNVTAARMKTNKHVQAALEWWWEQQAMPAKELNARIAAYCRGDIGDLEPVYEAETCAEVIRLANKHNVSMFIKSVKPDKSGRPIIEMVSPEVFLGMLQKSKDAGEDRELARMALEVQEMTPEQQEALLSELREDDRR
jgi:hypothetical protein